MARIKPKQLLLQSKTKKGPTRISYSTIITWNLIVILVVFSLYATYRHWHQRLAPFLGIFCLFFCSVCSAVKGSQEHLINAPVLMKSITGQRKTLKWIFIVLRSNSTIEKYTRDASADVVDKFINLCKSKHFKGVPFRHVIKNFVIHGGDFDFDGAAQEWILKAKASGKNDLSPRHEAFMIGTAKNPNNKGFDLFITTAPIPDLNDKLVVFGRVVKGEDIVQEIEEVDTDEHYRPKTAVGIIDIMLKQDP
ncbi:hypothetical protein PR202_ga25298 [Eleusine coracana subsp. coracana]|uniref:Peptidyl-prolyl cis-trans isomerase n=1 Tax=Eleusine coracana subsp. coracana TaxID=191504 RepID=A0AAV5DBV9_ELECO|nr:hypothetical protein PR202_ga25298 [Eleusine coracana subsp. coracana]